jgi:hypothetical protein
MSSEGLAAHMLGKSPAPWALVCPLLTALQTNALVQLEPTPLITSLCISLSLLLWCECRKLCLPGWARSQSLLRRLML